MDRHISIFLSIQSPYGRPHVEHRQAARALGIYSTVLCATRLETQTVTAPPSSYAVTHTHTQDTLTVLSAWRKPKGQMAEGWIRQMHRIEETTGDKGKTTAALTFHVSDNSVSQQKLYFSNLQ